MNIDKILDIYVADFIKA